MLQQNPLSQIFLTAVNYLNTLVLYLFYGVRCLGGSCSIELVCKPEEFLCCKEINRCGEVMENFGEEQGCKTSRPGFQDVCLNQHVLEVASLSLKTRSGKSYRTIFAQGQSYLSRKIIQNFRKCPLGFYLHTNTFELGSGGN